MSDNLKPLKTWSHLAGNRRRPTEYEIVSTKLLWNTPNHDLPWRMASNTPQIQWIIKNRNGSLLQHSQWDAFRDPDQMVYRTYSLMQDGQESYVDGLLEDYSKNQHDWRLDAAWLQVLSTHYAPARYVVHAVQMASSYLIALAPCSTVANALMLQGGDQLRWVSRIAYRTIELADAHPALGFGKRERGYWESHDGWRGFIELAERALVAWDWGECFMATNLVLKPAIDEAFMHRLAAAARQYGDTLTASLLEAQFQDSQRSRRLTAALVEFLVEGRPENKQVLDAWLEHWVPLGERAIAAFCQDIDPQGEAAQIAQRDAAAFRQGLGLAF